MSEDKKTTKGAESVKNLATASLVLGIVGVATCWFGFLSILGFAASIVGIILAVKARKVAKTNMSTAGLVLSIIVTCLGGVGIVCAICAVGIFASTPTVIQTIGY